MILLMAKHTMKVGFKGTPLANDASGAAPGAKSMTC